MACDTETAALLDEAKERLKTLKAARASGVLMTRHGETLIQFNTISDLNKAISAEVKDIRRLERQCGEGARTPSYVLQNSKGLGK
jgi:seryl-tRNA(Sec) selenium transferase